MALCDGDESREAVARGKGACGVLHALLRDHRDAMQLYAARALRLLASDATVRIGCGGGPGAGQGGRLGLCCPRTPR